MNKKNQTHRFSLTLLVSFSVFAIIAITLVLAIILLHLLSRAGVIGFFHAQSITSDLFLFTSLVSLVIGFLVTMLTSKLTLMHFNRIIDQLNRLAKGDFKARLEFGKPIGDHPTFQEIQQSFNRAAEELEHTEVLRNDFINNFSHEFKTPIVSIAGFAKLLRHGNLTEEQKQEYLAVIEEESLRLSYMATNVLNLTKIENQTILTEVSNFNLSEQIRAAILLLADKWMQKNLDMDIDFQEYLLSANEELLKQVWINLLDNAIKFSESNGKITVTISEKTDKTIVTISNHGNDIPSESLSRIFNKFYQADESHSSEGNGIGLAIVKKVVDLHKGEVFVKSNGGTTTFTVHLPNTEH